MVDKHFRCVYCATCHSRQGTSIDGRTYPELEVGDKVKILRKKGITEKERTSHFLKGNFTVKKISTKLEQKYYDLEGFGRPLMRHELLKVCYYIFTLKAPDLDVDEGLPSDKQRMRPFFKH